MKQVDFEWDDKKEKINIKKHGIDFEIAAHVFADEQRIEKYDYLHSIDEDRYIVIGSVGGMIAILTVVYTERNNSSVIRIISARLSTKDEKEEYYNGYSK